MDYQNVIPQFRQQKILVIGELMLDVYLYGTSNRICREAPVPVVNVQSREDVPGAAANAAVNLAALGAQVRYLSITGQDRDSQTVIRLLSHAGVHTSGVVCDPTRQTITKRRVLSDGQLIVRYDDGSTGTPSPYFERQLIKKLTAFYPEVDAVLLSDYGYGVITDRVIAALQSLQQRQPKLLVVDSKNLPRFHDLHPTAVKPNYAEAIQLLGLAKADHGRRVDQILAHGHDILDITGAMVAAVTIDSEGAVIFERGKSPYRTYARPVPNSKAAGAGDTYIGTLTLGLSSGLSPLEAAELATAAATVVVHKDGTSTCSAKELMDFFKPPQKVITDRAELASRAQGYREQGRKIVFTNGCFDILHRGHITYLTQAKALGDILVVAVNSDEGVRRLKGADRPINLLEDRMHVLAALDCVDHVVAFEEDTPVDLIRLVKPDVYAKGGDYTKATLPEAPFVEALGGKVEILPYINERSTTAVIEKIRALDKAG
ncbi:MAG: D-glycero-beta-D-manno-heptose 1-phosphate adenylyltransferase [Chloroflexi bacterium]|nr:D-glycero-beta-D-manno-heptose 1-phosphate adenylyltransferase [Chloroflexota bacterium]